MLRTHEEKDNTVCRSWQQKATALREITAMEVLELISTRHRRTTVFLEGEVLTSCCSPT